MAFGLSISTSTWAAGSAVQLHLWIDNQTDTEASVMTCMTRDFFWNEGFDVYDAYGHRLLKKNEIKRREKEGSPAKPVPDLLEPRDKDCLGGLICARNFAIPIPAHTCTNTSAYDLPYDFNRNLADSYDLSPGVYYIVPTASFDPNLCRRTVPTLDPSALRGKLKFTVEQN